MKTRLIGALLAIVLAAGGAIVLVGYVRAADVRAANGAELVSAYVVTKVIPAGTPAAQIEKSIEVKQIPASAAVPGRITRLSVIAGRVSDVALKPGEQLLASRWVTKTKRAANGDVSLPDGMQSVTIALPVERAVGGTVKAGDTVGILIAAKVKLAGSPEEVAYSKQEFHKVLVLAVQQGAVVTPKTTSDSQASKDPVSVLMVTVARPTPDVEKLIWGQLNGTVWLTSEPAKADESGSATVTGSAVFQ
ncbi:MAG: pilus assembly protein CpaB [Microbacteriaceae bacterium]|jgi:pilus assembly protein CpaB|nr:pilus assembly protein CpaB [Microbacteriaceae bacterium]